MAAQHFCFWCKYICISKMDIQIYGILQKIKTYSTMKNTKYTHITERCSSILRDFASSRIEQQTGQPVSRAYWRLRDGLGLLTISDSETLGMWCDLITHVRKYTGSPVSLDSNFERQTQGQKGCAYRQDGGIPLLAYDRLHAHCTSTTTLRILPLPKSCLNMPFPEFFVANLECPPTEIPAEELQGLAGQNRHQRPYRHSTTLHPQFNINLAEYQLREYIKD